jgi:hypothetical protein
LIFLGIWILKKLISSTRLVLKPVFVGSQMFCTLNQPAIPYSAKVTHCLMIKIYLHFSLNIIVYVTAPKLRETLAQLEITRFTEDPGDELCGTAGVEV